MSIVIIYFILIIRCILRRIITLPPQHNRPKKLTNHHSRRLLPLASPMGRRHPNPVHRPHSHIVDDAACAWFGHPMCLCWDVCYDRHIVKVLDLSATMFYNAPLSNVPLIVPFSVPNAPVPPSPPLPWTSWLLCCFVMVAVAVIHHAVVFFYFRVFLHLSTPSAVPP